MKKYCFTKCFKKKIEKVFGPAFSFVLIVVITLFILGVLIGISYVTGCALHHYGIYLGGKDCYDTGVVVVLFVFFIWSVYYYIVVPISGKISDLIHEMRNDNDDCKIIEECGQDDD